jgi:hypothetical protein
MAIKMKEAGGRSEDGSKGRRGHTNKHIKSQTFIEIRVSTSAHDNVPLDARCER